MRLGWARVIGVVTASLAMGLVTVPAHAIIVLPEDPNKTVVYPAGIDGEFQADIASPLTDLVITEADSEFARTHATCEGCSATHIMYWRDYGAWEYVGIKLARAKAEEVIDRITAHAALMHGTSDCYEGSYSWQGNGDQTHTREWRRGPTPKYGTTYNDTWTLAGGRNWYDDGAKFSPVGGQDVIDICKKF